MPRILLCRVSSLRLCFQVTPALVSPHNSLWFECGDQLVSSLESSGTEYWRDDRFQYLQLHRWIDPRVNFSRLHVGMCEAQRHFAQVLRGLECYERRGVTQYMWGHPFCCQRGATTFRCLYVLVENVIEARARRRVS